MSTSLATYHGGDGDGRDPPDPSRVLASCESVEPKVRKGRGLASNAKLEQRRRDAGKPLELEVDLVTGKVVGTEASAYVRFMGQQVSILCPGHHYNFSDVPQQYKDHVLNRIGYYFNIDGNPHRELLMGTLYTEMAERYSERKTNRHRYFKQHYTKPEDWEKVLQLPPDYLNTESWKPICEMFISKKFLNRSSKNKANRQQMKYPTTQGTRSLASIRHGYGGPPGEHAVDAWKAVHTKQPSGDFVNEVAAKDYEELVKELDRKRLERQSQSDTSSTESHVGYQYDVLEKVLGERSDYQRGVGKRVKGKGKKSFTQSQSTMPPPPATEMFSTMAEIFSTMRDTFGSALKPEQRANLYNPRFENFIQMYSQSQSPGDSSSQSYAAPPQHQQQPPSQQQPQSFPQQQQQSGPQLGN
ncbi:hypothetical protein CsatB_004312 [Cannabis sativa]